MGTGSRFPSFSAKKVTWSKCRDTNLKIPSIKFYEGLTWSKSNRHTLTVVTKDLSHVKIMASTVDQSKTLHPRYHVVYRVM
jgi:hypothetical protein